MNNPLHEKIFRKITKELKNVEYAYAYTCFMNNGVHLGVTCGNIIGGNVIYFNIDNNGKLILAMETKCYLGFSQINILIGEVTTQNILYVYDIFFNGGRGSYKFTDCDDNDENLNMKNILDNKSVSRLNNTKSARIDTH